MKQFYEILFDNSRHAAGKTIAFLGGGGKTSLLLKIGGELSKYYDRILLTSLTKSENILPDNTLTLSEYETEQENSYMTLNPLFIMKCMGEDNKWQGLKAEEIERISSKFDFTLIECDGAKKLSLKGHNNYDPVVPDYCDAVIIVAGADVVGSRICAGKVHRPELFKTLWGLQEEDELSIDLIVEVLTTRKGYLSKLPNEIERIYFVNKADKYPKQAEALAAALRRKFSGKMFWGSLQAGYYFNANA